VSDRTRIDVRPARPGDLERLVDFQRALAAETEDKELDEAVLRSGLRRVLSDPQRGRYFVAERAGAVVGSLLITLEWSDWRDGWIWWIQSVYTAPEARRSGVYRAMHRHVLELARAQGDVVGLRLYVEAENRAAQCTYEAHGMRRTSYLAYEHMFRADRQGGD
jgi:ribosomal protein S18 acetylase RimI-like enzyme